MRTRGLVVGLLLLVVAGATGRLYACGDKFLTLGRGTRYERSPAERRAAAIILYADPGSEMSRLLDTLSVEAALKKEGYRPSIIGSAAELDTALRARKWDVIVIDASNSQRVRNAGGPRVVPVLIRPTKDELKHARNLYRTVINTPTKSRLFLETIDDAVELHEAETTAAARATRH